MAILRVAGMGHVTEIGRRSRHGLILDDWGPDRLTANQRRDLMEIVEDRYGRGSTLITSQLPIDKWHDVVGEPTFADAILDRCTTLPSHSLAAVSPTTSPLLLLNHPGLTAGIFGDYPFFPKKLSSVTYLTYMQMTWAYPPTIAARHEVLFAEPQGETP